MFGGQGAVCQLRNKTQNPSRGRCLTAGSSRMQQQPQAVVMHRLLPIGMVPSTARPECLLDIGRKARVTPLPGSPVHSGPPIRIKTYLITILTVDVYTNTLCCRCLKRNNAVRDGSRHTRFAGRNGVHLPAARAAAIWVPAFTRTAARSPFHALRVGNAGGELKGRRTAHACTVYRSQILNSL
jgi:hypothetical protein